MQPTVHCALSLFNSEYNVVLFTDNCSWTLVTSGVDEFPPRAGHTSAYVPSIDSVITFGGRDLNDAFNDVIYFSLNKGNDGWKRLQK